MTVPVLAIVGYSNSGKTTLMEKLISKLSAHGLNVCSIKHSHHQLEMDTPGKDSWRHKQAGASGSLLVGPEQMLMVKNVAQAQTPQQLADTHFPDADLVLVEGYASMPCPKIEVVRQARSSDLRCDINELIAVVADMPDLDVEVPKLDLNHTDEVARFVLEWLKHD
ncbi:molybdopterin-guanine dinucleotide biosynthesis protein B [Ghiorsea bivora]|uniref:molybdopterin-guanine dinucleotide biosynthesis protein B n=1 Tax=Ghiorsea bivora TaxID=1485545 RepID=UPI00056DBE0A|nr:molybdopterin-guanine dinucleotide biosynthesis protein B [Ghiorsea bivora]